MHFPDETECRKTEKAERKLNIESQGDETISRDCITDATTATEKVRYSPTQSELSEFFSFFFFPFDIP